MDLSDEEVSKRHITCTTHFGFYSEEDQPNLWVTGLTVELHDREDGGKTIYHGKVEMIGEFTLHPDVPPDNRRRMVSTAGGAILYTSIREWVANVTARSFYGMVELPTVDARAFAAPESVTREQ